MTRVRRSPSRGELWRQTARVVIPVPSPARPTTATGKVGRHTRRRTLDRSCSPRRGPHALRPWRCPNRCRVRRQLFAREAPRGRQGSPTRPRRPKAAASAKAARSQQRSVCCILVRCPASCPADACDATGLAYHTHAHGSRSAGAGETALCHAG